MGLWGAMKKVVKKEFDSDPNSAELSKEERGSMKLLLASGKVKFEGKLQQKGKWVDVKVKLAGEGAAKACVIKIMQPRKMWSDKQLLKAPLGKNIKTTTNAVMKQVTIKSGKNTFVVQCKHWKLLNACTVEAATNGM